MGAYSGSKRNTDPALEDKTEKKIQINVSEDKLSAYLVLKKPDMEGEENKGY